MKLVLYLVLFSLSSLFVHAGFVMKKTSYIEIPFKNVSGLILIPVELNGRVLTFILDSGVAETLLFSLDNNDSLLNNAEKMWLTGLGGNLSAEAFRSINNRLSIAEGQLIDVDHTIYMILNEDFNFSAHLGVPVNGLLGYQFFKDYVVGVDYRNEKIIISTTIDHFPQRTTRYKKLALQIMNQKAYVELDVLLKSKWEKYLFLLDIGNSESLLFFPGRISDFQFSSKTLKDYIGKGFNGDITGIRGRIPAISLGFDTLLQPIVSKVDSFSVRNLNFNKNSVGLMGYGVLSRFDIIVDYPQKAFYFKPNKDFSDPFQFNMSGLTLKHDGLIWKEVYMKVDLTQTVYGIHDSLIGRRVYTTPSQFQYQTKLVPSYQIVDVREGSPGAEADIREGDLLIEINGRPSYRYSLQQLYNIFSYRAGKKITILINRNGKKYRKKMILKDPFSFRLND